LRKKFLEELARDGDKRTGIIVIGGRLAPKESPAVTFACWLRGRLADKDFSARAAADRAGFPETTVWNWTFGNAMPRSDAEFERLGKVLGCTLQDFYADTAETYRRRVPQRVNNGQRLGGSPEVK
jgi:hypothetical protein